MASKSDKNYHLGHFLKESLLKDPDAVAQIDAATGEEETRRSLLARSITLARCLRTLGLQPGDVLALGGDNHLDLHIPFYAALMNGYPICGVDPFFKFDEIRQLFNQLEPKIAFCQQSSYQHYRRAVEELGFDTRIVTFDGEGNTMADFIQQYDVTGDKIDEFQIADFDLEKVYAWLVCSSGSTGYPKVAAMKHRHILKVLELFPRQPSKELRPYLNLSAVHWLAAFYNATCTFAINHIKLQTSAPATPEHVIDIINKYRPPVTTTTPSILYRVLHHEKPCDLTCFNNIIVTGAYMQKSFLQDLRAALRPDALLIQTYGQTESLGPLLQPAPEGPLGNCGVESRIAEIKLVDPVTGEIITEPNVPGELLWGKGPFGFTEYYNNPEDTAKAFTPDGWCKTGDLLKRDENGYYFFMERLKMLIKYRIIHVVPLELEEVILTHDGVEDVCVTSIANPEDGEWPVAIVVRKPGSNVSAQEINGLVAEKLSEPKQIRGVMFVNELPMTSSGKIARGKVKKMAETAQFE